MQPRSNPFRGKKILDFSKPPQNDVLAKDKALRTHVGNAFFHAKPTNIITKTYLNLAKKIGEEEPSVFQNQDQAIDTMAGHRDLLGGRSDIAKASSIIDLEAFKQGDIVFASWFKNLFPEAKIPSSFENLLRQFIQTHLEIIHAVALNTNGDFNPEFKAFLESSSTNTLDSLINETSSQPILHELLCGCSTNLREQMRTNNITKGSTKPYLFLANLLANLDDYVIIPYLKSPQSLDQNTPGLITKNIEEIHTALYTRLQTELLKIIASYEKKIAMLEEGDRRLQDYIEEKNLLISLQNKLSSGNSSSVEDGFTRLKELFNHDNAQPEIKNANALKQALEDYQQFHVLYNNYQVTTQGRQENGHTYPETSLEAFELVRSLQPYQAQLHPRVEQREQIATKKMPTRNNPFRGKTILNLEGKVSNNNRFANSMWLGDKERIFDQTNQPVEVSPDIQSENIKAITSLYQQLSPYAGQYADIDDAYADAIDTLYQNIHSSEKFILDLDSLRQGELKLTDQCRAKLLMFINKQMTEGLDNEANADYQAALQQIQTKQITNKAQLAQLEKAVLKFVQTTFDVYHASILNNRGNYRDDVFNFLLSPPNTFETFVETLKNKPNGQDYLLSIQHMLLSSSAVRQIITNPETYKQIMESDKFEGYYSFIADIYLTTSKTLLPYLQSPLSVDKDTVALLRQDYDELKTFFQHNFTDITEKLDALKNRLNQRETELQNIQKSGNISPQDKKELNDIPKLKLNLEALRKNLYASTLPQDVEVLKNFLPRSNQYKELNQQIIDFVEAKNLIFNLPPGIVDFSQKEISSVTVQHAAQALQPFKDARAHILLTELCKDYSTHLTEAQTNIFHEVLNDPRNTDAVILKGVADPTQEKELKSFTYTEKEKELRDNLTDKANLLQKLNDTLTNPNKRLGIIKFKELFENEANQKILTTYHDSKTDEFTRKVKIAISIGTLGVGALVLGAHSLATRDTWMFWKSDHQVKTEKTMRDVTRNFESPSKPTMKK